MKCRGCRERVPLGKALRIRTVATGERFIVHRPGDEPDGRNCFRDAVMGVAIHVIEGVA